MIDFLQRYVIANFGYKVVSLALAIGLWWALSNDPIAEVEVTVPIEFHNIPVESRDQTRQTFRKPKYEYGAGKINPRDANPGRARGSGSGGRKGGRAARST